MKKFIYPAILNSIVLFLIPKLLGRGPNAMTLAIGLVVFGNAVYFLVQSKILATKYLKAWQIVILNEVFIVSYMFLFLGGFIVEYFVFYSIMMLLGIKLGINKKRINDFKNSI